MKVTLFCLLTQTKSLELMRISICILDTVLDIHCYLGHLFLSGLQIHNNLGMVCLGQPCHICLQLISARKCTVLQYHFSVLFALQIDLMPHDLITQLLRVLAIETKQEKSIINADPTELTLSGLEAFSFDYIVKWPLSLIINR